jgi:hypothetical protein
MTKSDIYERHSDNGYNAAAFSRAMKKKATQNINRKRESE